MSTKESGAGDALPSVAQAKDGEDEPQAKKQCMEHHLMRAVRSVTDEFAGVPSNPIWLAIACFMEQEERERVFKTIIPELKGMELLADAKVASWNARKSIFRHSSGEFGRRGCYFVKEKNMASLFPAGIASFINEVNGPDAKPKKPTTPPKLAREEDAKLSPEERKIQEKIYKQEEEIYKLKCQSWPFKYHDRVESALHSKNHLYSAKDPMSMLVVEQDDSDMWFEWGADKCGFGSSKKFAEFCALAGVDPTQPIYRIEFEYSHREPNLEATFRRKTWVSYDRKVTFTTSSDPRRGGYCHYFGCTGVRPRCKFLFEWFKENGSYDEYCWNGRSFI